MKFSTILNLCCALIVFLFVATTTTFAQSSEAAPGMTANEPTSSLELKEDFGDVIYAHLPSTFSPNSTVTGGTWCPADTSFWICDWQSDTITRADWNGNEIEKFISPASNARSLTFDGTNMWFGSASTTITAIDITTRLVVSTITAPAAARFLTYDEDANMGAGGFWLGNWSTDIYQIDMTGNTLSTITDASLGINYTSRYGGCYDNISPGGPYLWIYHQGGPISTAVASQIHISSGAVVREMDFNAPFGSSLLAGGLFITDTLYTGTPMLNGFLQNSAMVGVDLLDSATITFEINTANIVANGGTVSADGIYLAGGSGFGVPGDNPATDVDGDGIWTVSVTRPFGFSSHYTFLNGNCPGWGCKEQLAGLPCSDPNNFDDRFFPAVYSDTTVLACFGSCESDGTCTPPATPSDITFNINMDSAPDSIKNTFTTVYVSGNFNGWSGDANPLTDNGDGTWTATVTIPATSDSIEYKFQVDNWAAGGDEQLTSGDPCTITDPSGAFVNRSLDVTGDEVLPVYCWSVCSSCLSGTNGLQVDNSLFTLNPSLVQNFTNITFSNDVVNQDKQVFVYNAVGSLVANTTVQNQSIYRLETADFANGLYFVTVKTGNTMLTQKFVVSK